MNRQVSQLAKQMSKTGVDDDKTVASTNSESSEEEVPAKKAKVGSNLTNASLTHRRKCPSNPSDATQT
jgi:hypothetical protein